MRRRLPAAAAAVWSHDGGELLLAAGNGALLAYPAPAAAELDTSASFLVELAHREVPLPAALARGLSRRAGARRRVPARRTRIGGS